MTSATALPRNRLEIGLGRHQTFHLRAGWLVKALDGIRVDPEALSLPESHHNLGVGKNMAESIRYWVQAADLAAPIASQGARTKRMRLALTDLGRLVARRDPYFEDIISLWAVHTRLASRLYSAAWYWLFNEAERVDFTDEELLGEFHGWLRELSPDGSFSESQVRREVSCLRRTYLHDDQSASLDDVVTCPLSTLDLLRRDATGRLHLRTGPKPNMPLEIVAYVVHRFANAQGVRTMSLDALRWETGSPGRVLALDSSSLWDALQLLHARGEFGVRVDHTAGLRNVTVAEMDPTSVLERYFDRRRD